MTTRMNHYVCDRCGNYWPAMRSDECPACKHDAVWEFPPDRERDAKLQAAHIKRGFDSGLFREVRS